MLFTLIFVLSLLPQAQAGELKKIEKNLAKSYSQNPGCELLAKGPKVELLTIDKNLHRLVQSFQSALLEDEEDEIRPLFHPQLKVKSDIGSRILAPLKFTYGQPLDITLYRLFALYSPNGDKKVIPCSEDQVLVANIFGYKLQIGVWLQVLGPKDAGRIFLILTPRPDDQWAISAIHLQQWSYHQKDVQHWIKMAQAAEDPVSQYMWLDIAQKLLEGGSLLKFPLRDEIKTAQSNILTPSQWVSLAQEKLKNPDLAYLGTILAPKGPGIVARVYHPKSLTLEETRTHCRQLGKQFYNLAWLTKDSGGLRCDFLLPGEPATREGRQGSQLMELNDLGLQTK